jgi:hypothetical protein
LDVHNRPELVSNPVFGYGVRYQQAGLLESLARRCLKDELEAHPRPFRITIQADDPAVEPLVFDAAGDSKVEKHLIIKHASPRFYTFMLMAPSPWHALLLNRAMSVGNAEFTVNDEALFVKAFTLSNPRQGIYFAQKMRRSPLPATLCKDVPDAHFLDGRQPFWVSFLVAINLFFGSVERFLYDVFKARFMVGEEPWLAWERAANIQEDLKVQSSS